MDSIKQQQPEKNYQDLQGAQAIAQIRHMIEEVPTGFFCTHAGPGGRLETRPMNVRQVDAAGNLWFLSAADSVKNAELATDTEVELFFQGGKNGCFLHLCGLATVTRDRAQIDALWSPLLNTWFTGGKDDPRITVIRVMPTEGYYWDHKHGDLVAGVKMLIGAATRQTLDDSIEGKLRPH
jgi:general stress protein 26